MYFRQLTQGNTSDVVTQISKGSCESGFYTGAMSGCSSLVLLWQEGFRNTYENMRGLHLAGGIANLQYGEELREALFGGVPNEASTLFIVLCSSEGSDFTWDQRALAEVHAEYLGKSTLYFTHMHSAYICNKGIVTTTKPRRVAPAINKPGQIAGKQDRK